MSVFRQSVLITLAGKRARMTNGFIFIALGFVAVLGAWSLVLAVMLDRANKEITKLKMEIKNLIPF